VETRQIRVLLVDDDQGDFEMIRVMLSQAEQGSYKLDWVGSYEEALDAFRNNLHDVYLLDYFLEDRTGIDLLKEAEALGVGAPIIMLTGRGSSKVDLAAMEAGAADYLVKGTFDPDGLERAIRYSLERGGGQAGAGRIEDVGHSAAIDIVAAPPDKEFFGGEGRFRAVFRTIRSPVALVDLDGLLLEVNPAFARVFLSGSEDAEGRSLIELLSRSAQAPALRDLGALSREEVNQVVAEREFLGPEDEPFLAHTSLTLIRAKEGHPEHLVAVVEGPA
jgi:PAS domain S-box-containing protein